MHSFTICVHCYHSQLPWRTKAPSFVIDTWTITGIPMNNMRSVCCADGRPMNRKALQLQHSAQNPQPQGLRQAYRNISTNTTNEARAYFHFSVSFVPTKEIVISFKRRSLGTLSYASALTFRQSAVCLVLGGSRFKTKIKKTNQTDKNHQELRQVRGIMRQWVGSKPVLF